MWSPEHDDGLRCVDVHDETHDVKSFTFVSVKGKEFDFLADSNFMFELGIDNEVEGRCYSISSSPLRRKCFHHHPVKRVAGGKISNCSTTSLKAGMDVRATGTARRFVRPHARKFLFLSGGSGITPLMSDDEDNGRPKRSRRTSCSLHAGENPARLHFQEGTRGPRAAHEGAAAPSCFPETVGQESLGRIVRVEYPGSSWHLLFPDISERVVMCCGPAPIHDGGARLSLPNWASRRAATWKEELRTPRSSKKLRAD